MGRRIIILAMLALSQAISFSQAAAVEPAHPPKVLLGDGQPPYPSQSRRQEHEGTVILRLAVSAEGAVGVLGVAISSGHSLLDAAAADYAKTLQALPARGGDGKAMYSETLLSIVFRLDAPRDLSKRV